MLSFISLFKFLIIYTNSFSLYLSFFTHSQSLIIMLQAVQFLAILLSFVLIYFLVSGFNFNSYVNTTCDVYSSSDRNGGCEHGQQNYCGDAVFNLKSPFRFEGDTSSCKYAEFELSCRHNRTVLPVPSRYYSRDYYYNVDSIDYENRLIRVIDPGLQKDDCSTLPLYYWEDPYFYSEESANNQMVRAIIRGDMEALAFVSCKKPVKSKSKSSTSRFPLYVDTASCNITQKHFYKNNSTHNFLGENEQSSPYTYAVVSPNLVASDIQESCTIHKIVSAQIESLINKTGDISFQDIHNLLAHGFLVHWYFDTRDGYHRKKGFVCHLLKIVQNLLDNINTDVLQNSGRIGRSVGSVIKLLVLMIAARNVIGILLLIAFLLYKWSRRHLSRYDNVEEFLQANNGLMPIRYSYKEIKSMTKSFKEKLGEGGYGLVYKGKLRSGNLVAVKMLSKSKANGQEFINEVATIGRIHHVNVVRLVGFCVTNSKRALVYDYMPNGSLDKFIFSTSSNGTINPLSWKKAFEIAMGIARGIEYLHRGCNMQILHFDIKPHNILLDENFVPKISDFGLAKLYPIQDGYIATLTAARGTLGYMAPELFYKKIGRVSYKADVYSFGMLLMEMAGRRRNVNAHAEHSSQIYFPSWIYDKMDPTEDMEIFGSNIATDEEKEIVRKLILSALWCIQVAPTDRPSMREVLEMLEGDVEGMQLPPKPLLYPPDSPILHMQNGYSSSEESTEPLCRSITLEIEQIDN